MQQKVTWVHPRSRHWHLLDYLLFQRQDRQDVLVTKAIPGANGKMDHHLVISKMRLRIQPRRRPQSKRPPAPRLVRGQRADISALLVEKNQLHKAYIDRPTAANKTAFYKSHSLLQQRLWEMQDAWMARKAEEIQGYTDRNEWKNFAATKAVYGPPVKGTALLLSADGRLLLTEKMPIWTR
ncbi:unnamed protein product [Schistocephalus solidus]|uniref:Transposase n=1 Tax=Schistocephalus solidus TaxID=70667 RepID=A0A183T0F8_SCHSO|nr:unnamed protein product [Schistocephalus solidus]